MTRILIADDIAENRYLLSALFGGSGNELVLVENGSDAFERALQTPPDLIITDILMPVMDGFELCRRWKTNERLRSIPFIFYTATYTDPKDEQLALSLGADRFIVKPQKPETLLKLVREVLEESRDGQSSHLEQPLGDAMEVLRQHNQALFRKLEKKMSQLHAEIAQRRKVQEAFEESQQQLLEAHRLAHIGIWSWDRATDTVHWSEELYRIAGVATDRPAPRFAEQATLYRQNSWARLQAAVDDALQTAEPYQLELELVRPDGSIRWVEALGGPKLDACGKVIGMHGMLRDVTPHKEAEAERHRLEEQLRISQKMEAIGSLAGGVAHDFNNLLSVILSFTGFALGSLHAADPIRLDLLEVKKAADRAAGLTRQLLAFSRRQVLDPRVLDLNQIVTNLERMLRRLISEDIDLKLVLSGDLARILADPGQIEQVIMNLVVNARDAMPKGGCLTIETKNAVLDEERATQRLSVAAGEYVLLAISDTGCGMDDSTLKRLFEPFFTTKEQGKGTGLGLSTVYGIVKQSGGAITVYSEVGRGTTFKTYLPKAINDTETLVPTRTTEVPLVGTETILVVEDEEGVRKAAERMLRAAGYQVIGAANGGEALLLCENLPDEIHLLVTDVVMPRMSGRQLVERLRKVRPGLRVLYMSGYTDGAIVHHGVLTTGMCFISKPFGADELRSKVRQALDAYVKSSAGWR